MMALTYVVVGVVALLHVYFLVLEMFWWDKPLGLRVFRMTPEKAETTKVLAMNQGLYNGFLAAGLSWGAWMGPAGEPVLLFFLSCVVFAGIFGAATVSSRILWIQALPAGIAIALVLFAPP